MRVCVVGGGGGGESGSCVGPLLCFLHIGVLFSLACMPNQLAEEERAGCFTLIVLWLSVFCVSSSWCIGLVCSL